MRRLTGVTLFILTVLIAPAVAAQCVTHGHNQNARDRVNVYIESDFAAEMRASTSDTSDDNLTEEMVRQTIMQAFQIWENETRSQVFVFSGVVDASPSTWCGLVSNGTQQESVFVYFDESGQGKRASTGNIGGENCDDDKRRIFFRANDSNGDPWNHQLGSLSETGNNFPNDMVHEAGHIVGLGDIDDSTECRSVMADCESPESYYDWGGRHPLNWDKNCATTYSSSRWVTNRFYVWNSSGVSTSSGATQNTTKSFLATNTARSVSGYTYADIFLDGETYYSSVGTDGYLSFTWNSRSSQHSDVSYLDVTPYLTSFRSLTGDGTRIIFTDDENDSNSNTWYNPPYVQYIRTTQQMTGSLIEGDTSFKRCTSDPCLGSVSIRSALPIATTYDPVSGNTVGVWVTTDSLVGEDGDGRIAVFPGLAGSSFKTFEKEEYISGPFPTAVTGYTYSNRTDLPPSVVCADSSWSGSFNCIVAYREKYAVQNEVVYRLFKVNSAGDDVVWDSTGVVKRSGSASYSAPAVGFFNDQFYLAWRTLGNQIVVQRSSTAYSWNTETTISPSSQVVGTLSFISNNGNESALVYQTSYY